MNGKRNDNRTVNDGEKMKEKNEAAANRKRKSNSKLEKSNGKKIMTVCNQDEENIDQNESDGGNNRTQKSEVSNLKNALALVIQERNQLRAHNKSLQTLVDLYGTKLKAQDERLQNYTQYIGPLKIHKHRTNNVMGRIQFMSVFNKKARTSSSFNYSELKRLFIEDGVPFQVVSCFLEMFSKMHSLSEYVSCECTGLSEPYPKNCESMDDMSGKSRTGIYTNGNNDFRESEITSNKNVLSTNQHRADDEILYGAGIKKFGTNGRNVFDWRFASISVPIEEDNESEDENPCWSDLHVFKTSQISGFKWYIPSCPLTRCRTTQFFCSDRNLLTEILHEHGFPFYQTLDGDADKLSKGQFKNAIHNCEVIVNRLIESCNYKVGNRKTNVKKLYFQNLHYDLTVFCMKKKSGTNVEECGNNRTANNSNEESTSNIVPGKLAVVEEGNSRKDTGRTVNKPYTTSLSVDECDEMLVPDSQESDSVNSGGSDSSMENGAIERKQMAELITNRLQRTESNGEINTSWWRVGTFAQLARNPNGTVNDTRTLLVDNLFGNEPARMAYDAFKGYCSMEEEETTIMYLARSDAWISTVIEDMSRKGQTVGKGGMEPSILKKRYTHVLPQAFCRICKEVMQIVEVGIIKDGDEPSELYDELRIRNGRTLEERLFNNLRKYTIACQYPYGYYYICLKPDIFSKYVCSWIGRVRDCYIGFCTAEGRPMEVFKVSSVVEKANN